MPKKTFSASDSYIKIKYKKEIAWEHGKFSKTLCTGDRVISFSEKGGLQ